VIETLLRPDPLLIARQLQARVSVSLLAERARAIGEIFRDPRVRIALGTLMTSQLVMGAFGSAAGGMILGAWGFLALNALGALCMVGPLVPAWFFRAAVAAPSAVGRPRMS
jgi:hypothetical protein